MLGISLCMIVKDEEDSLGRCLSSVREVVDEIIIVDTGSKDRTKEIAASFGAVVYDFEWIDHFAAARNFAFERAAQPFIMWLDADDVVEPEDRARLKELKEGHGDDFPYDSVSMNYHLTFDQKGNPVFSLRRNRIVRRSRGFRWIGPVHEYLAVSGPVYHSDIAVTHRKERVHTDRNLRIYLKRLEAGETFSPRDQYYFANELRDNRRNEEAVDWYGRFLDGDKGWVEDNIGACMKQADCYGRLNDTERQLASLFRSFRYDAPRPEICCELGSVFIRQERFEQAIYWFGQALSVGRPAGYMGSTDHAASTWLPHLQLTVCHDRVGNRDKALEHHRQAMAFNPNHPSIRYNESYFNRSKK